MRVSVERLRIGLVVGAVLLVAVLGGFLEFAHLRVHRFLKDLPGKMGGELRQEANGYTYSQTLEGRTVFTIHAAKAVQRKDGKVTLHDVGIVLYDRTPPEAGKTPGTVDRIYGKEFEYEQAAGVVRAMGEVHIDLNAPVPVGSAAKMDFAAGREGTPTEARDDRVVHVKTSGLVYLQKLGAASTDQPIEFVYRGLEGKARGADYNADTGVLVLQSEVSVRGEQGGRPGVLLASHAVVDRTTNQVRLTAARYTMPAVAGAQEETGRAEEVVVYGAGDGSALGSGGGDVDRSPERVEARGSVVLTEGEAVLSGERGEMQLRPGGDPERARMWGGVSFHVVDATRAMRGTASEGTGNFDTRGRLTQVQMAGEVTGEETETMTGGGEARRHLSAGRLDLELGSEPGGRLWLERATASQTARLEMVTAGAGGVGKQVEAETLTDTIAGDQLRAELRLVRGAGELTRVEGVGHTELRRVGPAGVETSAGERLEVQIAEQGGKVGRLGITTAVQQGGVVLTKMGVEKGDLPQRASADRAAYDAAADQVTLSGGVRMSDGGSVVTAERVVMQQGSGDAVAMGAVRVSYLEQPKPKGAGAAGPGGASSGEAGGGDPLHVLATRAAFTRASQVAVFYQDGGAAARLWQGGSQVEAPVITLNQKDRTLNARGVGTGGGGGEVRTVFANEDGREGADEHKGRREDVVRVRSRELRYAEALRRADFLGGVTLQDGEGTMRSAQAEVFLQPTDANGTGSSGRARPPAGPAMGLGGAVERIVASGGVTIEEPARRGHGERLVYTASDGVFVLTGTPTARPEMIDEAQGRVVGESLRFDTRDNRIVIAGDASGSAGHRVRTETRVPTQR